MFKVSLTPDAAANLICDQIDDFVRCHGGALRTHDVFALGEVKGAVRQTQGLISSGWLEDNEDPLDSVLNSEVTRAADLLREARNEYEAGTA